MIEIDVKKNSCTLDESSQENMSSKQITLANEFSDRESDTESLGYYLASHFLMIRELLSMGFRGSDCIQLHCGRDGLVEMEQKCTP